MGHMELSSYDPNENAFYLPHHAVIRNESTTTKLRVVFNASQATSNGISLNDQLAIGANHQNDILSILIHFRKFKYAFTADVEKMYRQILVNEDDRKFQKILWRESPDQPISEYQLKTVTYGTSIAPFLATRTTKQMALDNMNEFPQAAQIILESMYMDDVADGAPSINEINKIYDHLRSVFSNAGFNLRKWSTNCKELMEKIPESDIEKKSLTETVKALGILWSPSTDVFSYNLKVKIHDKPFTKRQIIAEMASLFDPFGWICPIVISAKILIQEMWKQKLDWDQVVSDEISSKWLKTKNELHLISQIQLPRWINYDPEDKIELHGFADASKVAFASVIYIKNVSKNTVQLLIAKSRVAPLKGTKDQLTIPRLELCAANLLAKLTHKVMKSLKIQFSGIFLWSDSQIVIDWLHGNPKRYKKFIANRICLIDKLV
ncbi:uncharacterized protein LOC116348696, partial [Contarinia nasturtii]|uniref:uncharacterized protein LOC116348696 n=1 Tax=Contarinia nasturtii TaxID=265458 RepID=UPI0012D376FA